MLDLLKCLFENGGDPNVMIDLYNGKRNRTGGLLHISSEAGDLETTKLLLSQDNIIVDIIESDGKTLLHVAAEKGNLEICEELVRNGANLNGKDKFNKTPEDRAKLSNHIEVAKFLNEAGKK